MPKPIKPSNPEEEEKKGRVAVWLEPQDIEWLSGHCCCTKDAAKDVTDRCLRIRFRASAALHKAGLKKDE